jgi:hypothetical protein
VKFLVLLMLVSLPAQAAPKAAEEPIELTCVTEWPTTSFVVWSEGDEVLARVIHHNGSSYAPAIVGTFTPNDLPLLAERAALVKKMKNEMTFHWPRKKCKKLGELVLQCFGTDDVQEGEGGAKFAPFALYSTTRVEDGIAGRQESASVTLTFDVDGARGASIEMIYPKGSCVPRRMGEFRGAKLR